MTALVLTFVTLVIGSQSGPVTATRLAAPEKALKFEVTVPAPIDAVWSAFTTRAGLETWIWKDARVDLRPGGEWTVVYGPTATGGGTIESFVPKSRIAIRALAPERFPTVRRERTLATFSFEATGPQATKVTLVQTGWKPGAEWDAAYDYLATGNAQLLAQLHRRFASGPIDWSTLK